LTLEVTIPANTSAAIDLPTSTGGEIGMVQSRVTFCTSAQRPIRPCTVWSVPLGGDHLNYAIDRVSHLSRTAAYVKPALRDKLIEQRESITTYGEDLPEIRDGMWTVPKAT
jgi:phosphoketolase